MLLSFSNPKGNSRGHIPFLLNSVNCWLRCSRMLSLYRAVVNCTELKELLSIAFPRAKARPFRLTENAFVRPDQRNAQECDQLLKFPLRFDKKSHVT